MPRTRRHFSPEQKVALLRLHLLEKRPISDICEEYHLSVNLFYLWQKQFFENGAAAFANSGKRSKAEADAKAKLDDRDAKLAAFKSRYIGELPDDQQANLSILSGLNTQLDAATQALGQAQQNKAFAESMLAQQLANQSAGCRSRS